MTLLPVFYANREPFGKMLTLIDFAFEKKKENYYCYWRSICQMMIMIKNFYQQFLHFLLVFILVNGVGLIFLNSFW